MQSSVSGTRLFDQSLVGRPLSSSRHVSVAPSRPRCVRPRGVAEFVKEAVTGGNGKQNGAFTVSLENDTSGVEHDIVRKAHFVLGKTDLDPKAAYRATALSVREHLIDAFTKTQEYWR